MRFDGFIFDIEGTLIDCIPQNLRSWQETLASFGVTVSLEVLQRAGPTSRNNERPSRHKNWLVEDSV